MPPPNQDNGFDESRAGGAYEVINLLGCQMKTLKARIRELEADLEKVSNP